MSGTRREIIDKLADSMDRENAETFVPFGPCAECRFWGRHVATIDIGECALTQLDATTGAIYPSSRAQAIAGPGADAVLQTRAEFGCVQWERKP